MGAILLLLFVYIRILIFIFIHIKTPAIYMQYFPFSHFIFVMLCCVYFCKLILKRRQNKKDFVSWSFRFVSCMNANYGCIYTYMQHITLDRLHYTCMLYILLAIIQYMLGLRVCVCERVMSAHMMTILLCMSLFGIQY